MAIFLLVAKPAQDNRSDWSKKFTTQGGIENRLKLTSAATGVCVVGSYAWVKNSYPQSFDALVTISDDRVRAYADYAHRNSFRRPVEQFNLIQFSEQSQAAEAVSDWPELSFMGGMLSSSTLRNARLFKLQGPIDTATANVSGEVVWVNPLVMVLDRQVTAAAPDTELLKFLCLEAAELTIEPVSAPNQALRDLLFDELTSRLRKQESCSQTRPRSLVERLIWGPEAGRYRHRAFIGLDSFQGRFKVAKFGTGAHVISWQPPSRASDLVRLIAKHWCQALGVTYSTDWTSLEILSQAPHGISSESDGDDCEAEIFAGDSWRLKNLQRVLQNYSQRSVAGKFLSELLALPEVGTWQESKFPDAVRSWQNFNEPRGDRRRFKYDEFVERTLASMILQSVAVIDFPEHGTTVDGLQSIASRLNVRRAHFQQTFGGRGIDLVRSRVPGRTAFLSRLLQALETADGTTGGRPVTHLRYSSEWWIPWEAALYHKPAHTRIVFGAPEEGPFYLDISNFGDKLDPAPANIDEDDMPRWPKAML